MWYLLKFHNLSTRKVLKLKVENEHALSETHWPEYISALSTWHQWVNLDEIYTMPQDRQLLEIVTLSHPRP